MRHFGPARQLLGNVDHSPSFLRVAHTTKGSYEPQRVGLMTWHASCLVRHVRLLARGTQLAAILGNRAKDCNIDPDLARVVGHQSQSLNHVPGRAGKTRAGPLYLPAGWREAGRVLAGCRRRSNLKR